MSESVPQSQGLPDTYLQLTSNKSYFIIIIKTEGKKLLYSTHRVELVHRKYKIIHVIRRLFLVLTANRTAKALVLAHAILKDSTA